MTVARTQRNLDIVAAVASGETAVEVGRRYGITRERVRQIYTGLTGAGISRPPMPPVIDCPVCGVTWGPWADHRERVGHPAVAMRNVLVCLEVIRLYQAGGSTITVAHETGLTLQGVTRWLSQEGITRPKSEPGAPRRRYRRVTDAERADVIARIARGESWNSVARRHGRAINHLQRIVPSGLGR